MSDVLSSQEVEHDPFREKQPTRVGLHGDDADVVLQAGEAELLPILRRARSPFGLLPVGIVIPHEIQAPVSGEEIVRRVDREHDHVDHTARDRLHSDRGSVGAERQEPGFTLPLQPRGEPEVPVPIEGLLEVGLLVDPAQEQDVDEVGAQPREKVDLGCFARHGISRLAVARSDVGGHSAAGFSGARKVLPRCADSMSRSRMPARAAPSASRNSGHQFRQSMKFTPWSRADLKVALTVAGSFSPSASVPRQISLMSTPVLPSFRYFMNGLRTDDNTRQCVVTTFRDFARAP
jgi:hypothetical protein